MANENPKNIEAILKYIREKRSDCLPQVRRILELDKAREKTGTAALLLLVLGFEAGREFQKDNPEMPLGGGSHYLA
jgi:hypothetical protein